MDFVSFHAIVLEYPHQHIYYFLKEGKLFQGKGVRNFEERRVDISVSKEIKFVNLMSDPRTKELAKRFGVPVLHSRKIKKLGL